MCRISSIRIKLFNFQMFLIWILFTGTRIHTLKGKEKEHHIITKNAWCIKCTIFNIVSSLFYMRGRCIHTLKEKKADLHILTNIPWWVKWWRGLTVSSLYFVHRYAQTHIDTQTPHHDILIRITLKIKILNSCVYFYFEFSWQGFPSTQWNGKNNITTYWQTSLAGLMMNTSRCFWIDLGLRVSAATH